MGRQAKAATARLNNLQKSETHQKPNVDVFDDEGMDFEEDDLLEGFFFLDKGDAHGENFDSDSDDDEVGELGEEELDELQNEAAIEHFNAVLFEAQAMTVKAEHEAAGKKPKRKWHNTGNSDRTK
jgi:hypothetical protein